MECTCPELTRPEVARANRFAASAYEAVQGSMQPAVSMNTILVKKVLNSLADEERIHEEGFLRLFQEISPGETSSFSKEHKRWK
jgi:rubrerythrin